MALFSAKPYGLWNMLIGGLQKNSFIDFPGKIAAVVFTKGCNLRCPYCHNPELLEARGETVAPAEVLAFLEKRQGLLQGVVISGGEPCVHPDLPEFIRQIRRLGYAVKLDSNGSNPEMLGSLLQAGLLDYLALDLKTPLAEYGELAGAGSAQLGEKIAASMALLAASGLPGEFRTTCAAPFVDAAKIEAIAAAIAEYAPGYPLWLQAANWQNALIPDYATDLPVPDLPGLREAARKHIAACEIR